MNRLNYRETKSSYTKGVYMIINPENEVYIGRSRNLYERICSYRPNPKDNRTIAKSIIKYGIDSHSFIVLETFDDKHPNLSEAENFYIQYMRFIGATVLNTRNIK